MCPRPSGLHVPLGGSYSCPHPSPWPPFFLFSSTGPPPYPLHLPLPRPPNRNTQANALATPGANYPLVSAWVFPRICLPKFWAKFGWTFGGEFLLKPLILCIEVRIVQKILGKASDDSLLLKDFFCPQLWGVSEKSSCPLNFCLGQQK